MAGTTGVVDKRILKCFGCGGEMISGPENVKYDACGLPGVTLVGVEVSRCGHCGEYEVAIPRIEELHRVLASALVRKSARLTPAEIRFLRTTLGWSGRDLADHMGATAETVSRWEHGKALMGPQADRLLRLMVLHVMSSDGFELSRLKDVARGKMPADMRARLVAAGRSWAADGA